MSDGDAAARGAPRIGPGERLRVTVLFSAIIHTVLALGVGFALEDPAASLPSLDVTLVATRSATPPEEADFLANANQEGGGDAAEARRITALDSGDGRDGTRNATPSEAPATPPQPIEREPEIAARAERPRQAPAPTPERNEALEPRLISGRELMQRSAEVARLAAEVERREQQYAKRPRRHFINSSTREYAYAAYMRAWVARVERIGNLNYPDDARRRKLAGSLVLTVAIRRDGSVEAVDVIQPSGHRILDEAALAVVKLAAPFAPLPPTAENPDVLHITRTWQFQQSGLVTQ